MAFGHVQSDIDKPSLPKSVTMFMSINALSCIRTTFAAAAFALGVVGIANAEGYDLNKQVSGGGGGGGPDPEKQRIVRSRGAYICLDVSPGVGNQVRFTLRSLIPEPNARLTSIYFDTGRHKDLFTGVAVVVQSLGLKSMAINPTPTGSSGNSGVRYRVDFPYEYSKSGDRPRGGFAPGNFIVISAALGPGKSIADVVGAINESINPATEPTGLKIWVTAHFLLGGPPRGVGTIHDDATFMLRGVSQACRAS